MSVVASLSQVAVVYTFASVLLTWAHLHHFGVQGVQKNLMRKQVIAVCGFVCVVSVSGFISIEMAQDWQLALDIAKGFVVVQALFCAVMAACFLLYGRRIFDAQILVEKKHLKAGKTQAKQETQRAKNPRFTWRLAKTLCFLFIVQSTMAVFLIFHTNSPNFEIYVGAAEIAVAGLLFCIYGVYHPKVKKLRKGASSKASASRTSRNSLRNLRASASPYHTSGNNVRSLRDHTDKKSSQLPPLCEMTAHQKLQELNSVLPVPTKKSIRSKWSLKGVHSAPVEPHIPRDTA